MSEFTASFLNRVGHGPRHVTLLYLGGDLPEEKAAARANLSIQDFRKSQAKLEKLKGPLGCNFYWDGSSFLAQRLLEASLPTCFPSAKAQGLGEDDGDRDRREHGMCSGAASGLRAVWQQGAAPHAGHASRRGCAPRERRLGGDDGGAEGRPHPHQAAEAQGAQWLSRLGDLRDLWRESLKKWRFGALKASKRASKQYLEAWEMRSVHLRSPSFAWRCWRPRF